MKKVICLALLFNIIFILYSCQKSIKVNIINVNNQENISYNLPILDKYTLEDLPKPNMDEYIFLGYSLSIDGKILSEYDSFILNNNDNLYAHYGISKDFFKIKSIGNIFIEVKDEINSKEDYRDAKIEICMNDYYLNTDILIRLRGNSTLWVDKKSYKLKFSNKVDLFGMGEDKEWALLANYFDPTYMRNYYAYKLAIALGLEYSVDCEYVELYLNNEYQGLYLLCEQVKTSKNRVNIEEGYDINKKEVPFLLELDMKLVQDDDNYQDKIDKDLFLLDNSKYNGKIYPFGTKYPKDYSSITNTQYGYIKDYISEVYESVRNGKFYSYIDIESFINYFLIQELFMNVDLDYSSVYMYKPVGEKLKFGPIWDFDLSSGNVSYVKNYNVHTTMKNVNGGNYIFEEALKDKGFKKQVLDRLKEINKEILPLMFNSIDYNYNKLYKIAEKDNNIWNVLDDYNWARPIHLVGLSYYEQVNYFKSYLEQHNQWLLQKAYL